METLVGDTNNPYGVHSDLWRWEPQVGGPSFRRFLENSSLPVSAQEYLRQFTPRVLGQAYPPSEDGQATGLVIGRVQSGKTNSFLALSALASDNGYRIIVILSGTKNLLKDQTHREAVNRLSRGVRGWKTLDFDPSVDRATFESRLRVALSGIGRRALVITLLKRTRAGTDDSPDGQGVDRLADFFESSDYATRLSREPVLIIDDEADEAGLDNSASARRQGRGSTPTPTHVAITRLRALFERHFFVQYTATPQANLLVELTNQLAPDFCELLQPGDGYCGAAEFFPTSERHFAEIPAADVLSVANESEIPPQTLIDATRLFFVGAALEDYLAGEEAIPATRSMLVHPERTMQKHRVARRWVLNIREQLLDALDEALTDPNGPTAGDLETVVARALAELGRTLNQTDIAPRALFPMLRARVEESEIKLINSQDQLTEELDWSEWPCWIFVGGDVLQRGFAMQGLTVTWMPRSPGGGQVDVMLQRGRFFGYRRPYFDYCRVWLPRDVHDDYYALFADHETSLWRSLRGHLEHGGGLAEWSRMFWLDEANPALRLCRQSTQWFRLRRQDAWASQLWYPHQGDQAGIEAAATNAELIRDMDTEMEWSDAWRPAQATPAQMHEYAVTPLETMRELMSTYTFFGEDTADQAVIKDAIWRMLQEDPSAQCAVVKMRPGYTRNFRGPQRGSNAPRIGALLGGRAHTTDPTNPKFYPGDAAFHLGGPGIPEDVPDGLTLQIHQPEIRRADGRTVNAPGDYLERGCPLVTVYLPEEVRSYRREGTGDR